MYVCMLRKLFISSFFSYSENSAGFGHTIIESEWRSRRQIQRRPLGLTKKGAGMVCCAEEGSPDDNVEKLVVVDHPAERW